MLVGHHQLTEKENVLWLNVLYLHLFVPTATLSSLGLQAECGVVQKNI